MEDALSHLFMRKLKTADYGVAKFLSNTKHFALAFDLYTHFTSPIRFVSFAVETARFAFMNLRCQTHAVFICVLFPIFLFVVRRYADVMVHRVLSAVLQLSSAEGSTENDQSKSVEYLDAQQLDRQCTRCNEIRLNAKYASEECSLVRPLNTLQNLCQSVY